MKVYPYIERLEIEPLNHQDRFEVVVGKNGDGSFKHLLLTGKNGSGKTSLLSSLYHKLISPLVGGDRYDVFRFPEPHHSYQVTGESFVTFLEATRRTRYSPVQSPKAEENLIAQLMTPSAKFAEGISQLLVNRKVGEAFAAIEKDVETLNGITMFFSRLENVIRKMMKEEEAVLLFDHQKYAFRVKLPGGSIELNDLPHGYSSLLGVFLDLCLRVHMTRELSKNYSYDPPGIVLIDEPELHLHLEMQYEVLPMLIESFPQIQFVVATHSPAVASSLKNATVFDLSTKEYAPSYAAGMSFTDLMEQHFGVENEFGPEADNMLKAVKEIYLGKGDIKQKIEKIREVRRAYVDILNPVLNVELESMLIRLEAEASVRP